MIAKLAGRVEFVDSKTSIAYPITGDACRIAFAALALAYPQGAIPDRLAHAVWGDEPPRSWQSSLRNIVSRLRKQLPNSDAIESTANGYRVTVDGLEVDVQAARQVLLNHSDVTIRRAALDTLKATFVPGASSTWVEQYSAELTSSMLEGFDRLAADFRARGDARHAFVTATEAVALAPLRETSRQELLRAHLLSGARADGLRAYEMWRRTVGEELGAVPSPETEKLYLELLGIDSPSPNVGGSSETSSLEEFGQTLSLTTDNNNGEDSDHSHDSHDIRRGSHKAGQHLVSKIESTATRTPSQFHSPLIGRGAEVDQLASAIEHHRFIAVSGLGGVGKSHLVAQVLTLITTPSQVDIWAQEKRSVYWIAMEALERSHDPVALLADLLTATSQGGSTSATAIREVLASGSPIVILDGATQRGSDVIVKLLAGCPNVTTIVTSRQLFDLPNTYVQRVGPMGLLNSAHPVIDQSTGQSPFQSPAETQSEAALLLQREACRLGADSAIWTISACEAVANRLDGIALGLILAAKRAPVMSPQVMVAALDQRGTSALDHGREQSLEAVVGWTISELPALARRTLEALAIVPEPLEFDPAMQICASDLGAVSIDPLTPQQLRERTIAANGSRGNESTNPSEFASALTDLLNVGLLRRESIFGRTRFVVLQVAASAIRQTLSETRRNTVLDAHARYFIAVAQQTSANVRASDEFEAVRSAELNVVNFTVAIDRFLQQGHLDEALQMSCDLTGFAFYRLNQSLGSAIVRVVSSPGASASKKFCEAAASAALMAWMLGDQAKAKAFLSWSEAPKESWLYRQAAGIIALYSGDTTLSTEHFEASLAIADANDSLYERAISLSQITLLRTFNARVDALDSAIESFRCGEDSKNPTAKANGAWAMGIALLDIDPEGASEHLLTCRELALGVNARLSAGSADAPLAMLEHRFGATFEERCANIERQIKFWLDSSHSAQFWLIAQEAAVLLCERGNFRSSALILGAVSAAPFKVPLPGTERRSVHQAVVALRQALGERYRTIHQMGTALSANSCAELIQRDLLNGFSADS